VPQIVRIDAQSLSLAVSPAAQRALSQRGRPLFLELELYFSCLVRKRVHVREDVAADEYLPLTDRLYIRFRPVVTQTCAMREVETGNPPLLDMPMVHAERFFPHWLTLDYRSGRWLAEFGYATPPG
jgi:hypothetical protein